MSEWQPIETAPKDGTWVLACMPSRNPGGYWACRAGYVYGPELARCSPDARSGKDGWRAPYTHWMPLPAPPDPSVEVEG